MTPDERVDLDEELESLQARMMDLEDNLRNVTEILYESLSFHGHWGTISLMKVLKEMPE